MFLYQTLFLSIITINLQLQRVESTCPYANMFAQKSSKKQVKNPKRITESPPYFTTILTCTQTAIQTTISLTELEYDNISQDINNVYDSINSTCTNNTCPQADFAGCVVRLAGHDFMDFRKQGYNYGGSDGCINLNEQENRGLEECLQGEKSLQTSYDKFCTKISLADFVVLAAESIMAKLANDTAFESKRFKQNFMFGRTTASSCDWNTNRMPDPEKGCDGLQSIFIDHIYYAQQNHIDKPYDMPESWILTAAISGAHTLGRAQLRHSGYDGWWSDSNNSRKFNNDYYSSMILKGWGAKRSLGGNVEKNQWERVDVGRQVEHKEMMLDTDMCLAFKRQQNHSDCVARECPGSIGGSIDPCEPCNEFINQGEQLHAKKNLCCTWIESTEVIRVGEATHVPTMCGVSDFDPDEHYDVKRDNCCRFEENLGSKNEDCDLINGPKGVAFSAIKLFLKKESLWLDFFHKAWFIATTNGYYINGEYKLQYLKTTYQKTIPEFTEVAKNNIFIIQESNDSKILNLCIILVLIFIMMI